MARAQKKIVLTQPLMKMELIPHGDTFAAIASAPFKCSPDVMMDTMLHMDEFPDWVPILDRGSVHEIDNGSWQCALHGKMGIWKLGIPVEMRFDMEQHSDTELIMTKFHGGTFKDIFFHHVIKPRKSGGELESLYYFDLQGFALIRHIPAFKKNPSLVHEMQIIIASMMVKGMVNMADRR